MEDHRVLLRKKLLEEATEYLLDPCLEELADVHEVVSALAAIDLGQDISAVRAVAGAKRRERGGFKEGVCMFAGGEEEIDGRP